MLENPFAPRSPAPPMRFVNREREIDLIFGHLSARQRGNVAVNGPLGIGKTSLLHYVNDPGAAEARGIHAPDYLTLYVDVQSVTPFSGHRFWRRIAHLAAREKAFDLGAAVDRLLAREAIDVIDIEEFLDALSERGITLVLLLDEFEWALQADSPDREAASRDFLAQTASLARRSPRSLCLVVATVSPLHEATKVVEGWRGSPFATVFTSITLRPMDEGESEALVDRALDGNRTRFSSEELQKLYGVSSGQPAALQAAAFALYHGKQHAIDDSPLWHSVKNAAREALEGASEREARPANGKSNGNGHQSAGTIAESAIATNEGGGSSPGQALASGVSDSPGHGLWIEHSTGEVMASGRRVESLTALEYSLLRLLYANPGRLCSKEDIIRQVWGEEFLGEVDDSRVEKLISRLRRKIEPMPGRPQFVRTVRGRGYRYMPA